MVILFHGVTMYFIILSCEQPYFLSPLTARSNPGIPFWSLPTNIYLKSQKKSISNNVVARTKIMHDRSNGTASWKFV